MSDDETPTPLNVPNLRPFKAVIERDGHKWLLVGNFWYGPEPPPDDLVRENDVWFDEAVLPEERDQQ